MILEFKTERNTNGNARYLGIDTDKKKYTTTPHGWIEKSFYKISVRDYKALINQLKNDGYTVILYI